MSRRPAASHLAVGALALIVLAGFLLRLPSSANSLFGDELSTYFIVTHHSLGGIVTLLDGHSVDLNPPLLFLLARAVHGLGSSPQLLRLVSLVAGTAAIPLTYLLGLRTVGRLAALTGAALMALSPFVIFYSTEARAYALVMLLVLVSSYCLVRALEDGGTRWWVGYAAASCAAIWTHYTAVFVLAAQFAWAFVARPRSRRALVGASVAAAIGFAPWVPTVIRSSHSPGTNAFAILEPFDAHAVVSDVLHWAVGHPFLALAAVPGTIAASIIVVGVLVAAGGAAIRRPARLARPREAFRRQSTVPVVLALATPVGLALYSAAATDTWDMRNLISSWPGLALTAGALLASPAPRVALISSGLVVGGYAIAAAQLLASAHQRPQYGAAAALIIAGGARNDPVAVVPAPTPGPLTGMDAAFAYAGEPGRPLLRVGSAALGDLLRARPYAPVAPTPSAALARQAADVARGTKLFVVAPGTAPLSALLRAQPINARTALGPEFGSGASGRLLGTVFGPLSDFLRAALPRFRPVETRVLPGVMYLSVYVLERR